MAALETVTVQPQPNARPRQERISARVRAAIDLMVDSALSRAEAAKQAGLTDHGLYQALCKPSVLAYRNERLRVIRTSEASRTIARAAKLADTAESEHVQLQANTWLAGLDSISPVTRSESTINHRGLGPGLVIQIANVSPPQDGPLIPSQPNELELSSNGSSLDAPVPHPAWGTPQISGDSPAPEPRGRGKMATAAEPEVPPARL